MSSITTVVLSGGSGSRLWPVSRQDLPKPFMTLPDSQTLIAKTYLRAKALGSDVLTVTNRDYYHLCQNELQRVGIQRTSFILEPFGRNTAPALGLASKFIYETQGPDTIVLSLPADHLVDDHPQFFTAVSDASKLAADGYLVTFGILPTSPETGFGYIERGECLEAGYKVARFVEKPSLDVARDYLSTGNYLWNSGMFCFKADVFLHELQMHAPDVAEAVELCWDSMRISENYLALEVPDDLFDCTPDVSVDCALMERSSNVAVVPGEFGWSDIGSWNALRALYPPDEMQNRHLGDTIFVDSSNNFVQAEDRIVATVGVDDLIIVDTSDALLVAHQDRVQDIKQVVTRLKRDRHASYKAHRRVARPWGCYTVLEENMGYKIKRIEVEPGASLSLQMHQHRSEHWVVVSGIAKITNGEQEVLISVNQSAYIPAGQKHRLENPGENVCVMIEVQCGQYLEEDDIVRFDDKYGR